MDKRTVITQLRDRAEAVRALGATGLFLFGSRARGDQRARSDVDLFIDYDRSEQVPKLLKLIELERVLADRFGVPVSITTRYALHPAMKEQIEREAIQIF